MSAPLDGKVAFVTGAANGLGARIAGTLAGAGCLGVGVDTDRNGPGLPSRWRAVTADVTVESELQAAYAECHAHFGRLDVVVANAGVVPPWRETEALDLEEWDRVFAVNVRGVAATIKHAVPLMKSSGGSIVVMGSLNSRRAHPLQCLYTATKHAVLGVVRAASGDLGRYGIRVNALGPGPIATAALVRRVEDRAAAGGEDPREVFAAFAAQTSLGRMATEGDVARAALFLASDQSDGITGQLLPVDAGLP